MKVKKISEREPQKIAKMPTTRRAGAKRNTQKAQNKGKSKEVHNSMEEITQSYHGVLNSTVNVHCSHCEPNYELPWTMESAYETDATGFILEGKKIVTAARNVHCSILIKVKHRHSDVYYTAKVVILNPECNLALLKVTDNDFWEGIEAASKRERDLPFLIGGDLPKIQDSIRVFGNSADEGSSVTAGVTNRILMHCFSKGAGVLVAGQMNASVRNSLPKRCSPMDHCNFF